MDELGLNQEDLVERRWRGFAEKGEALIRDGEEANQRDGRGVYQWGIGSLSKRDRGLLEWRVGGILGREWVALSKRGQRTHQRERGAYQSGARSYKREVETQQRGVDNFSERGWGLLEKCEGLREDAGSLSQKGWDLLERNGDLIRERTSFHQSVCSLYRIISNHIKICVFTFFIVVLFTTVQDLSELPDNVKVRSLRNRTVCLVCPRQREIFKAK